MSRILSAVAWPYANGPRHIGHVAGFGVPSDVFSRYMRMAGHDVLMISGTDEHGTPILVQSEQEGVSPQELADRYNRVIEEDLLALGLSYDLFTRTTTGNHYRVAQAMFKAVHANGYMIEQTTRGAISPSTGRTLPDRYIEGTCPLCGYDGARGDQCDNCGNQLDAIDLKNPHSKINGEVPQFVETEHFFLDLPSLSTHIAEWLESRQGWRPNVLNFSLNLLDDIRPRAMTRDIDWGIPVPLPGWEDNPNKRLYVWFDAVIGYLSSSIEWARRSGDPEAWRKWWNDPDTLSYYFMGKDNITFHSQIWPGELIAANGRGSKGGTLSEFGDLQLPTEVVSSEFLTMESSKFSSSRGHVILVRDMLNRYQPDALRYFIAVAGPETSDSDFTWAEFKRRTNDELVATWGNLVNRTATLLNKNLGSLPELGALEPVDIAILDASEAAFATIGGLIAQQRQRQAVSEAMRVVSDANKYLGETQPWKLKNTDPVRMATVLGVAAQLVSDANTFLSPFLPHSAQRIHEALGGTGLFAPMPVINEVEDLDLPGRHYPVMQGDYSALAGTWKRRTLTPGTPIPAAKVIFTKLDDHIVEDEVARMAEG
jgi:methionyl-tRNA synthetase